MNLTPKSCNMQSEITAKTAQVGDVIFYTDVCNCNKYNIVSVTDTDIMIQDVDEPEWVDVKTFEQLSNRWTFGDDCRRMKEILNVI